MRLNDLLLRHFSGYAIVVKRSYRKYGRLTYVDRVCNNIEEAKMVKTSIERCDSNVVIIIKLEKGVIKR